MQWVDDGHDRARRHPLLLCVVAAGAIHTQKRQQTPASSLVALTPGSRKVSNVAARPSKKAIFVRVRFECRALTRSSFPFKIQKPSNTTGVREG